MTAASPATSTRRSPSASLVAGLLLLVGALALPWLGLGSFFQGLAMTFLIDVAIVLGFHVFMGYTGQINFGVSGFVAVGAYAYLLLQRDLGLPYPLAVLLTIPIGVVLSLVLSELFLRLRGHMMAIATLVFGLVVWLMARSFIQITGGDDGIPSIKPELFGERLDFMWVFYIALIVVVLLFLLVERIVHSRMGRALNAVEHDELVAATVGIDTRHYLRLVFVISGTAMVLGGVLYAQHARWVSANDFSVALSFDILVMTLVGGVGHNRGMFAGVAVMMAVGEALSGLQEWRLMLSGIVLLAILFLAPQGIAGELTAYRARRRAGRAGRQHPAGGDAASPAGEGSA